MPLEITLTNEQQVRITANPRTAAGNPAALDGPVRVTIVSGDGTAEAGLSDLEVVLVSSDMPGDTMYVIEADADLGEGVETISDTVRLTVIGARASNLGLVAGTPEPK